MSPEETPENNAPSLGDRILAAASRLVTEGGHEAATTRAIAAAAGVQPPAIYRLFGDKSGLLSALAEYELARYVADKEAGESHPDPVANLAAGWDMHVEFCLANPGLFALLRDDAGGKPSAAAALGKDVLRRRIRRIAEAGRLTTSEERALSLVDSVASGTIMTLLAQVPGERDADLSPFNRDMVIDAITHGTDKTRSHDRRLQSTAAELRASLDTVAVFSPGEKHLLGELLERLAIADTTPKR